MPPKLKKYRISPQSSGSMYLLAIQSNRSATYKPSPLSSYITNGRTTARIYVNRLNLVFKFGVDLSNFVTVLNKRWNSADINS